MSEVRATKAAQIKVKCVNALSKRLENNSFDDIMLRELCDDVGISKVTFFKYFSCKEELLRYQYRIWCYQLCIDLDKNGATGSKGVHFIFNKLKKDLDKLPSFFLAYISYRVKMDRLPAPFPIRKEEKIMLFPEIEGKNIEYKSLDQLIEGCVIDAIFHKEINHPESKEISELLITMIYGIITRRGTSRRSISTVGIKNAVDSIIQFYK